MYIYLRTRRGSKQELCIYNNKGRMIQKIGKTFFSSELNTWVFKIDFFCLGKVLTKNIFFSQYILGKDLEFVRFLAWLYVRKGT